MQPFLPCLRRCAFIYFVFGLTLLPAEILDLRYEIAPAATGPWRPLTSAEYTTSPNGGISVNTSNRQSYFRLRISRDGAPVPALPLNELPAELLRVAQEHVRDFNEDSTDGVVYEFLPFATLINGPAINPGSNSPIPCVELRFKASLSSLSNRLSNAYREIEDKHGYMIMPLTRDDIPILEFAFEGASPVERLLQRCGTNPPARVLRYNPTFWAAEDAAGRAIATLGTQPFRIVGDLLQYMNTTFEGNADSEAGTTNPPPPLNGRAEHYANYDDFKQDYTESPLYQRFRSDRKALAQIEWNIVDGILPELITINPGSNSVILTGKHIVSFQLGWEEEYTFADITIRPATLGGGLIVTPGTNGASSPLLIRTAQGFENYILQIARGGRAALVASAATATYPKWKVHKWYAGAWGDQRKYYQMESDAMCPIAGCGPVAWAMLFGWWDHMGVPGAFWHNNSDYGDVFQSMDTKDAPEWASDSTKAAYIALRVQELLNEFCDVWCGIDSAATMPGDMFDALPDYLLLPASHGKVGYSYSMAYDLGPEDWNLPSKLCATAVKKDRVAIVGLGWLWHYALAYGYCRKDHWLSADGPISHSTRYLKCNEGWGKNSAAWYSAYDTFWGCNIRIWKK